MFTKLGKLLLTFAVGTTAIFLKLYNDIFTFFFDYHMENDDKFEEKLAVHVFCTKYDLKEKLSVVCNCLLC